ncbi:hypothetical protein M433DRAFT_149733 [Acidomyces richmondensis BFW]|nr:MAG: hypothetical protein FE78DRAFT_91954 [Acidomyces sp. 'richmondensis']KYG49686.1 hypothetical protein M433DRAFT_149733 [Acidomyces richmondensis BFW]
MTPKQVTLGKFFGNPNGVKAEPQQSKLMFSLNAEDKAKKKQDYGSAAAGAGTNMNEDGNDMNGHVNLEGTKEEAVTRGTDGESILKTEADSAIISKKRTASSTSSEKESKSDDEAPPAKRQRNKIEAKKRVKKGVAIKTIKSNKTMNEIGTRGDDLDSSRSGKRGIPRPDDLQATKPAEEEVDLSVHERRRARVLESSPPMKSKASIGSPKAELETEDAETNSEMDSGAEVEAEVDGCEQDEMPVVSAKDLQQIQSKLKSTKNLYPDWKAGDPVPYAALCTTFSKIEMTSKRLEILALCSAFLCQVLRLTPEDLLPTVLLMVGKLAADYSGIELGIGESLIMKAIGEATGRSLKIIKEDQQKIGDLGLVAAKSRQNQPTMFKPKPLTVRGVHEGLIKIATVEGHGSQGRKVDEIKKLLSAADVFLAKGQTVDINKDKGGASESKFIIRALEGKMRLGLADKNLQVALANAMVMHAVSNDGNRLPTEAELKKGEELFKSVYNELPAYEVIVPALLQGGIWKLRETCKLQPGVPLKPMLAKPTKSIGEVLDRFEGKDFTCEYKYDGERAQIHFVAHDAPQEYAATSVPKEGTSERGISNIFSRNSEDLSKKYPDILAKLPTWLNEGTKSFVLDCETCAWDVEKKHVLPFQQLMTRKRKDVKAEDIKVKVCVFAFDLLYLNGEALVNQPLRRRRELMRKSFKEVEDEFRFAKFENTREIDEIQTLLDQAIAASCEGLMVKMLDGPESHYEPSRRSQNWLKVKKDYLSGAGDSLDLVVLGAYYGKGKRTSVYGAFQLACYNPNTEMYETVCNIGTGFSEAILAEFYETLSPIAIERPKPYYDHSTGKNDQPDVWFEPRYVWEVKTADLTLSPRYRAAASEFGLDGTHKGVSLRFPRFIRVRDDKKPEDATTSRQVAEMYHKQENIGKEKKTGVDDDFEY